MAQIGFYHLERTDLREALPRLLEKALAAGFRILVRTPDDATAEQLNQALWTYGDGSFLPHGTERDGLAEAQPVFLTAGEAIPNQAGFLCQVCGAEAAALEPFSRVADMFDGTDETVVAAARDRWRRYQAAGHTLEYWQQTPTGGWQRKGPADPAGG